MTTFGGASDDLVRRRAVTRVFRHLPRVGGSRFTRFFTRFCTRFTRFDRRITQLRDCLSVAAAPTLFRWVALCWL